EVGDPVRQALAQQEVRGHQEVDQKRRAAGEQDLVRGAKLPAEPPEQPEVRTRGPERTGAEIGAVVALPAQANDAQPPAPVRLLFLDRIRARREPGEHHVFAPRGALAGEQQAVLADGTEVGRQPVAEIDELVHRTALEVWIGSAYRSVSISSR